MDYQVKLREESGFTLVELAVVMIIIGILIGGILKGQEMITNARVTSTVSQMEALSAAKNDFQNQYNALPGDYASAVTSLTGCGVAIAGCGNGDGLGSIGTGAGAMNDPGAAIVLGQENQEFFTHLLAAGYISGMDGANTLAFGQSNPTTPLGGGFSVGHSLTGVAAQFTGVGFNARPGVYLSVFGTVAGGPLLLATQAERIDTKLDDGRPNTGGVFGDSGATCQNGAAAAAVYGAAAAGPNDVCVVFYRI